MNVVAIVVTLHTGLRFRLELGDGSDENGYRRDWLAPDERLPAAVKSLGSNLGAYAVEIRAAPLKMSLSVNVDGPALLGEVTAVPLSVVSTGDGLVNADTRVSPSRRVTRRVTMRRIPGG